MIQPQAIYSFIEQNQHHELRPTANWQRYVLLLSQGPVLKSSHTYTQILSVEQRLPLQETLLARQSNQVGCYPPISQGALETMLTNISLLEAEDLHAEKNGDEEKSHWIRAIYRRCSQKTG